MSNSVSVSSPRFGGCKVQEGSKDVTNCAFSPLDCSSPSMYVKAPEVEGNRCSHPDQVRVGRCSSSVDKAVCAVSSDACQIKSKFQIDQDCNIAQDKAAGGNHGTHYPSCNYERCVVSEDDCKKDGEESFFALGQLNWHDPCFCDKVPTGLCYLDSANPITKDSSYCAVGEYDCNESYKFMDAPTLLDLKQVVKPRSCYLCRQADLVGNESRHERVVMTGGCFSKDDNSNSFLKCALESTDCPAGSEFKSSLELRQLGIVPCDTDEMTVGKCTSTLDEIDCTSHPSACYLPAKYQPDDTCTVYSDVATKDPTFYGMCRESQPAGGDRWKNRCVWQESECIEKFEIWWYARLPQSTWLAPCNCEHVETGGCEYDDGSGNTLYYCAVSSLGCSDPSSYVTSYEMKELGRKCMLCQPNRSKLEPTPSPTSQGHGTIVSNNGKVPTSPTPPPSAYNEPVAPPAPNTNIVAPTPNNNNNVVAPTSTVNRDLPDENIAVYILVPVIVLAINVAFLVYCYFFRGSRGLPTSSNQDQDEASGDGVFAEELPTQSEDHSVA